MIDNIRQFIVSKDFVFVLLILGFILVITLLSLENRRDNVRIRQLNQKVKDLIAGNYSEILDVQGGPEITDITNSINDLSEVIRLTHENLEQETKRLSSILSYMTDGVLATNRRGQIIMINDMATKQLGVKESEARKMNILKLLCRMKNLRLYLRAGSFIIRLRTFMCRLWKNKLKPKLLRLWM